VGVEQWLVQILVVVAIIQMKTLKAEVEMVSATLTISCGLLGPKAIANSVLLRIMRLAERECG